ncbi:hypothetical protein SAY86_003665 [Trapa natans]|uniref:Uncharacterized protein n=1 Tax=Trapa natans TaxID=22666 RepID=A0AAN7M6I9_TRANT|nr:hypothetical protein SAY86_003665 [Trapa natans]
MFFEKFLPEDIHIRSNGRIRVAVTQILWRTRGLLVDQFNSKEDFINAVITSSFVPMFEFVFPAAQLGLQGIEISPDCNPENRATFRELFNWALTLSKKDWALTPAGDDILGRLFELGYLDASVWAESNPVSKIVQDDFLPAQNGGVTTYNNSGDGER